MSDHPQPMFPLPSDGSQNSRDLGAPSGYPVIGSPAPAGSGTETLRHSVPQNTKALLLGAGAVVACLAVVATTFALTRGADEDVRAAGSASGGSDSASETRSTPWSSSNPTLRTTVPTAPLRPDASRVALNVSVPITQPDCDGSGIVVLRSAVTPGNYGPEVQRYLNEFPGASYLRTDHSCPSLRQSTDSGNPIYAVYRPAGRTEAEICSAVRRAGGDAYGKWLDLTTDPRYMITC